MEERSGAPDGLVAVPGTKHAPYSWRPRLATAVFLVAVCATALVDTFAPLPLPPLVGAELAKFNQLDDQASWLDGTKARRVEVHGKLQSRTRAALGPVHTAALLRYFRETGNPDVLAGEADWLFLRRQIGVPAQDGSPPSVDRSAALMAAAARRITAGGTRFFAVPIPRKASVLADFAPQGAELYPGLESHLLQSLTEHGLETVDLRPMFAALKPQERYLRYDSHWAQPARVRAAEAMVEAAGAIAAERSTRLVEAPWTNHPTDLLRFAGVPDESWVRGWLQRQEESIFEVRAKAPAIGDGSPDRPPIRALKDRMPAHALFGTSFSRQLGDYIAHFADAPVFDGSQPGGFFLDSLANIRQCYNFGRWPEVIWYEVPTFKALRLDQKRRCSLSPSQGFSLSVLPIVPTFPLEVERSEVRGSTRLAVGRGHLITSGNGIAMVRVTRTQGGPGEGLWRLRTDQLSAEVPWHAARQELLIPIVATHELGADIELTAVSNGAPAMNILAKVVTDLDLTAAVPGTPSAESEAQKGGQSLSAATFPSAPIQRHSGIVAQIYLGDWSGAIQLRTRTDEGSVATWNATAAGAATVVLDLSRHTGQHLTAFEVVAPGNPQILSAAWAPLQVAR